MISNVARNPVAFQGKNVVPKPKPKVVVVGNGLGGVAAGRELGRLLRRKPDLAEVTIVGPNDQFVFKPQLHETLNGKQASLPMQALFPAGSRVQYKQASVTKVSIDPSNKMLETSQGPMKYDYLILAVGGKTAYYGHDVAAKAHAIPLEDSKDIGRIKSSILNKLAKAAKAPMNSEAQHEAMTFVIVGGGATGVEYAFELSHFVRDTVRKQFPTLRNVKPTITIIEAMPDILNGVSDSEKTYIKRRLKEQGIDVLYNHQVQSLGPEGFTLADKNVKDKPVVKKIATQDPVWVTGVKANPLVDELNLDRFPGNNRVKVTPFMEVPNRPDIYVIGDTSAAIDPANGRPLPPTGQVAEQQGAFVANDLFAKLASPETAADRKPFKYNHRGSMWSLGPGDGIINSAIGFIFKGRMARMMRDAIYYKKAKYP